MTDREVPSRRELIRQGVTVLRREGVGAATRAGLRVLDLNYQGYYYYYGRYLYRRLRGSASTAEPFTVLRIDPMEISHHTGGEIDRWDDLGAVIGGEWDRIDYPLTELIKYRSVVDRFENGTPWEETDLYREAMERVQRGEPFWNDCLTVEDVNRRTEHVEALFERIRDQGYRSQEELHGKPLGEIVLSRRFDRSMEEIAVAIGRNGEFRFVDGNHRLAISHVLDLESIPVHVVARHPEWEATREKARNVTGRNEKDERETQYRGHPDLEELGDENA